MNKRVLKIDTSEIDRRFDILKRYKAHKHLGPQEIEQLAKELNLILQWTRKLITRFRQNPVRASLMPQKSGPAKSSKRLEKKVEAIIEHHIQHEYASNAQPSKKKTIRRIQKEC